MNERAYLVTGASGFIGRALCRRLSAMGRVRAVLRAPATGPWHDSVIADLAVAGPDPDALSRVDAVFHFAGKAHALDEIGGGAEHRAITVDGTRRLLEACRLARVPRILFASSVKAMGEGGEVVDESHACAPRSEYGRAKRDAEELVLRGGYVAHATVLRLPLVYGPGQRGNLARMIEAIDRGRFPPVPRVANRRSMIHVDDVASAALLAIENPRAAGRAFIVTDGGSYSTRQIYELVCESLGVEPPAWTVPRFGLAVLARVGDVVGRLRGRRVGFDSEAYDKLLGSAVYDDSAAREVLGFAPAWDLRRALPEMVEAYQGRRAASRGSSGVPRAAG